ncbi:MAG: amidophosphoribosyltransferase [Bradymonadia bacterium]|jgi:amidophosphoribosyltransferase
MCGVIGVFSTAEDAFDPAVDGLFQMQHRGQDACGLAIADGNRIRLRKDIGHVRAVFHTRPNERFVGHLAVGHVRYPTQGANRAINAQPHQISHLEGSVMSLASNGDITNYAQQRRMLEAEGVDFESSNDGELILKTIGWHHLRGGLSIVDAIRVAQETVRGAFSAVLMTPTDIYAFRDPHGIRPLCFGITNGLFIVASETNALDINHVDHLDDVQPGEIVRFGPAGLERLAHPDLPSVQSNWLKPAHCVFEHVYFSRPDSIAFGQRVYDVRKRIGAWLAENDTIEADVVVPVPDSSNAMALGYAQASGIPFEFGLIRNHYVGRTFISPTQARRDAGVRRKFNPLRSVFKDKRVVLVDDSIVRGTTLRKITKMVRMAGATEVHLRIGSPVVKHSCFYGVDTPTADELIGGTLEVEAIRTHISADTLQYMSIDGLRNTIGGDNHCMACFDGQYPVPIPSRKASAEFT